MQISTEWWVWKHRRKKDSLLNGMSCTVLTRNELWGITVGEIPQAFNPLCCRGRETWCQAVLNHHTRPPGHAPHWVKMKPKNNFYLNLNCHSIQGKTIRDFFFNHNLKQLSSTDLLGSSFLWFLIFFVIPHTIPQFFKDPQNTAIAPDRRGHHCKNQKTVCWVAIITLLQRWHFVYLIRNFNIDTW